MQRQFVGGSSISRHLYCAICQDVFRAPMRAPCGHSFCAEYELPQSNIWRVYSCLLLIVIRIYYWINNHYYHHFWCKTNDIYDKHGSEKITMTMHSHHMRSLVKYHIDHHYNNGIIAAASTSGLRTAARVPLTAARFHTNKCTEIWSWPLLSMISTSTVHIGMHTHSIDYQLRNQILLLIVSAIFMCIVNLVTLACKLIHNDVILFALIFGLEHVVLFACT